MGDMHKRIDCTRSVLGHLFPDWKGWDSIQSTWGVNDTVFDVNKSSLDIPLL